jgi:hypothetical protein
MLSDARLLTRDTAASFDRHDNGPQSAGHGALRDAIVGKGDTLRPGVRASPLWRGKRWRRWATTAGSWWPATSLRCAHRSAAECLAHPHPRRCMVRQRMGMARRHSARARRPYPPHNHAISSPLRPSLQPSSRISTA